jgi:hypothetical protein
LVCGKLLETRVLMGECRSTGQVEIVYWWA